MWQACKIIRKGVRTEGPGLLRVHKYVCTNNGYPFFKTRYKYIPVRSAAASLLPTDGLEKRVSIICVSLVNKQALTWTAARVW